MSKSRGRKVKAVNSGAETGEIFWMSLEEAKQAMSDKYEFLVDRYERHKPKRV